MRIKKVEESKLVEGHVIDSLEVGSSTNAPSIDAVNNALNGVVLYESESGTTTDITLNDSVENYSYLEIYYNRHNNGFTSTKVDTRNLTNICLFTSYYTGSPSDDSGIHRFYTSNITITGNSLQRIASHVSQMRKNGVWETNDDSQYFYITKVIGYK